MINVTINGEQKEVTGGLTVDGLLRKLGIPKDSVIVERNKTPLNRDRYTDEPVEDGDQLELIQLMGGG